MSREALAEFVARLADDPALQEELSKLAEGTGDQAAVPTEAFVEFARARGFDFTVDEALGIHELGDDELDTVSGGAHPPEMPLRVLNFGRGPDDSVKPVPAIRISGLGAFRS